MLNRMLKFIDRFDLLFQHQHGFRKKFSTNTAIVDVMHNITSSPNNQCFTAGIFIDICKAFDSLSHSILLQKLSQQYGFRGAYK
jgi:hypothetical protein